MGGDAAGSGGRAEEALLCGVDLGGTAIKTGAVVGGTVTRRDRRATPQDFEDCVEAICEAVRSVCAGAASGDPGHLPSVGIGLPGVTDPAQRMVLDAPNLPFLAGAPLADELEKALGVAVVLDNDANVAALAEARHGAGQAHSWFLAFTLGTGIGGGLVLDGEVYRGVGMAGEVGHLNTGHERRCGCGNEGCLEAIASARAMEALGREGLGHEMALPVLARLAREDAGEEGDAARAVFATAGHHLGEALAQVALLLDLRVFLCGGGGAPVLDLLHEPALERIVTRAFGRGRDDFLLLPAALGNDAGVIGAAELTRAARAGGGRSR